MRRVILAILAAAAAAGCSASAATPPPEQAEPDRESIQLAAGSPHLKYLKIDTASESDEAPAVVLTGRVGFDENHTQRVASPVDGRAVKLLVETGDKVKVGQPLIELSSPNVGQLQADLQKAQQDLGLSEKALDRAQKLKVDGAVSEKDLAQAEADYRKAKADVAGASTRLRSLNLASADPGAGAALRAQVAGTVVERNVLVGQEVRADATAPLITISDLGVVWVAGDVYEQDLPLVQPGAEVKVTVSAYPDDVFTGTVGRVSEVVDPVTRTVKIRCVVPNAAGKLKPDMFAKIELKDVGKKIVIPSRSLLVDSQPPKVILVNGDNSFHLQAVKVGPEVAGKVRVLSGIKAGDRLVVDGAIFLKQEMDNQ